MGQQAGPSTDVDLDLARGVAFAGRYKIIKLLGQGDRKRTYLARDTLLGRDVALALVKRDAARADPSGTQREVEMLVRAGSHDNIVTLYDSGAGEGTEYLVFAHLRGGTLREYLKKRRGRNRPLMADEIALLGRQLARALSHLHRLGLIHRDIAPGNVWLDEDHSPHLGDFDSAIRTDAPQDPSILPTTTEAYAAPEQLAGGRIDERSDLYSLGAVLYEAASGERPPRASSRQAASRLATLRPDIPDHLTRVISRLLSESPTARPASAEEVVAALTPEGRGQEADQGILVWAETLPFPLASILWHYEGETDPGAKFDHLIKFFEALAQFTATVQLSAWISDNALFRTNRATWFDDRGDGYGPLSLHRATFGSWIELSDRLGQSARGLLEGQDEDRQRCRNLFTATDTPLIEALSSVELRRVLHQALEFRNRWVGHGGVTGPAVHQERLRALEDLLARTRQQLAWCFEDWILLRPGAATYSRGWFDLTATILKGANPAFRKKQVPLSHPADVDRLYLLNSGNSEALELVPLVRLISTGGGQEACYFYSRMRGEQVQWISYHFHSEPELEHPDPHVAQLLATIHGESEAADLDPP